jgi:hypothetical protein
MDIQQVITQLGPRLSSPLSRPMILQRVARREIVALLVAATAVRPLPVAAQDDAGGQCCMYSRERGDLTQLWRVCGPTCTPAEPGMRLLEVPVTNCNFCPAHPA